MCSIGYFFNRYRYLNAMGTMSIKYYLFFSSRKKRRKLWWTRLLSPHIRLYSFSFFFSDLLCEAWVCGKRNCPVDLCLIFVISMKERKKNVLSCCCCSESLVRHRSTSDEQSFAARIFSCPFSHTKRWSIKITLSFFWSIFCLFHFDFASEWEIRFVTCTVYLWRCVCVRKSPRFCQSRAVDRLTVPSHGDRSRKLGERAANVIYQLGGGLLIDELM